LLFRFEITGLLLSPIHLVILCHVSNSIGDHVCTADCLSIEQPGAVLPGGPYHGFVQHQSMTNNADSGGGGLPGVPHHLTPAPLSPVVSHVQPLHTSGGLLAPPSPAAASGVGAPVSSAIGAFPPTPNSAAAPPGYVPAVGTYMSFSGVNTVRASLQLAPPSPAAAGRLSINVPSTNSVNNAMSLPGGANASAPGSAPGSNGSSPHRIGHFGNGSSSIVNYGSNNGLVSNNGASGSGSNGNVPLPTSPGRLNGSTGPPLSSSIPLLPPPVSAASAASGSSGLHVSLNGSSSGPNSVVVPRTMTIDVTPAGGVTATVPVAVYGGGAGSNAHSMLGGTGGHNSIIASTGGQGTGTGPTTMITSGPGGGHHTPSNGRGLNPEALHAWKPNWFTQRRHWLRPRNLLKWGLTAEAVYLSSFVFLVPVTPWGLDRCGDEGPDKDKSNRFVSYVSRSFSFSSSMISYQYR
jgi:hypothetical protein